MNGNWIVELTVRELTLHDSMKPHHLVVENEEGKFSYDFKLAIEQPTLSTLPTPKGDTHCVNEVTLLLKQTDYNF